MKVSLNWVKEFTPVELPVNQLVEKIGAQLGAVEEVIDLGKKYQGIVIAKVVSCEKHPDADKLKVCKIDDGGITPDVNRDVSGYVELVCGGPNVAVGMLVGWIPPGAVVPNTFDKEPMTLEAREIRGVISYGMLGTAHELSISDDHSGVLEVDLNEKRLPLYDDSESGPWQEVWEPIETELDQADAFVFVSPEWDGMFSVGLHNMFHYTTRNQVLAHKPVMLVGVSSGMGGVYPLAQLRMTGPKNTHYVVSGENLRISNVEKVLVDGEITEDGLRVRAEYALKVLIEYAKALQQVRASGIIDLKKFSSGV